MKEIKKIISFAITDIALFAILLPKLAISKNDTADFIIILGVCILNYLYIKNFLHFENLKNKKLKQYKYSKIIVDNVPFYMSLKNRNGKTIFINSNSNLSAKFLSAKEDKYVIENKEPISIERTLETEEQKSDWYKIIKTPVLNSYGDVKYITVTAFNINDKIQENEKRETMFSSLTHDLKTPTLAQIKALDLLLNKVFGELNDNQIEIISQIKNSCYYMKDLIFQILDTYLYDSGKIILHNEIFDITEVLNSILKEISFLYKEKNQNIVVKTTLKNKEIISDKLQLKRVMTNLISNSINYGRENSEIEIAIEEENNQLVFKIKNTSQYIPEEKLKVIFEKFNDSNKVNKTGTGLGLYLTKGIVQSLNGEVFAQSFNDRTCIFGFILPMCKKETEIKAEKIKSE